MSEFISETYKRAARIQTVVCGFLFSVFSVVYLYVFQRDVLEALHFSLAHGKTSFAPLASALIITLVLLLLRWGVNALLKLRNEIQTLSYFPSCLLLGVLTDVGRDVYTSQYHTSWGWLLPLLLVLYAGLAFLLRRFWPVRTGGEGEMFGTLNWNVFFLLVLCGMTVAMGNSDRDFHHELQVERCLRAGDYEGALNTGRRSLEASRTLTALRSYAMLRSGQIGERLFQYPQYYASDGLFFASDSLTVLRYTNDSISALLGGRISFQQRFTDFLGDICYQEKGSHLAVDYYLSSLLLDKRLDDFFRGLSDFYEPETGLPRCYREAVLLYQTEHADTTWAIADSVMLRRFEDYRAERTRLQTTPGGKNLLRKDFGDTYWWYFDYQQ